MPQKSADQDLGLLQAVDERLACYGWLTNTGVKFVIVVDMAGRAATEEDGVGRDRGAGPTLMGLKDGDFRPVGMIFRSHGSLLSFHRLMVVLQAFKALQTAYIKLLQNPFYEPDEHAPFGPNGEPRGNTQITSPRFIAEVNRIGRVWRPGMTTI